jgi:hypothetical protein
LAPSWLRIFHDGLTIDKYPLSMVIAFWPSNDGRGSAGGAGGSAYPIAFGGEEVDFLGFGREVDLLVGL